MSTYGETEMQQFFIGSHTCSYEPPDLLVVEFRGPLDVEHLSEYLRLRNVLLEGQSRLLTLLLLNDIQEISPEVRRTMSRTRDPRPQATAIVGARYRTRVLAELITKAMRFFTGKLMLLAFFDDAAQGRAWLAQTRERL
jgi:hypothetical protein